MHASFPYVYITIGVFSVIFVGRRLYICDVPSNCIALHYELNVFENRVFFCVFGV